MKTLKTILFVAFAAISFASCQKELTDPSQTQDTPKKYVTFTGVLDDFQASRTTMWYKGDHEEGDQLKTYFMEGDYIMVNGCKSTEKNQKVDEGGHGAEIKFVIPFEEGSAEANPPYYAMTAYTAQSYDSNNHTYTIKIGTSQQYSRSNSEKAITHHSNADILAAYTNDEYNVLKFKHMCTFLAVTPLEVNDVNPVNEEEGDVEEVKNTIKTIYVRQGNGENIAGTWYLNFDKDNEPYLTPSETLDNVITYNCQNTKYEVSKSGIPLGETVMIAVPAYDYPDGLLITMKDKKGKFASFKIKEAKYADKGGMIIPFNPEYNPRSGVIKTKEDWEDFAAAINSGNDSKLYRWVGNGTVKLGANIKAENLTSITKEFPYVFDGCGYSIKRENANSALFSNLKGEIHNLTLEGSLNLNGDGAAFVKNIYAGAKIVGCTNNMNITFKHTTTHCYVAAFAAIAVRNDDEGPELLEISNCTNNGVVSGTVDVSADSYNTAVAGFIADVRSAGGAVHYDIILTECKNTAPITLAPISGTDSTFGMSVCGVAGIIGWCRNIKTLTLNNCDNSGAITVSADHISSETGLMASPTAVGGIIGLGASQTTYKVQDSDNIKGLSLTGQIITITNCDNSGDVYNCMVNASSSKEGLNKVYTGGLAGALIGKDASFAQVKSCTNTGNVITYDITSDDKSNPACPTYCAVAGGLIGCGGNLNIENCTVKCHIGNGKRQMVSWAGVIGYTIKPFIVNNATLTLGGYFQRISTYNMNRAVVAVVPANSNDLTIDLTGSEIKGTISVTACMKSGTKTACLLTTKDYPTATDTKDLTKVDLQPVIYTLSNVKSNLVNGKGTYTTVATSAASCTYAAAQ